MGEWANNVMAVVRERVELGADALGADMVEQIRQTISVPVETLPDGTVLRSLPGEDPRKEFGNLWASERHEVRTEATAVALDVINDAPYARRLNYGAGKLKPRPFHEHAKEYWFPQVRTRIRDAIFGK